MPQRHLEHCAGGNCYYFHIPSALQLLQNNPKGGNAQGAN